MQRLIMSTLLFWQSPAFAVEAKTKITKSFEQSYVELQKKIYTLKEKGEKVSDGARQEMDSLMIQMNHEHSELKRQLENRNQTLNSKIDSGKKTVTEDWPKRIKGFTFEVGRGFRRAWQTLTGEGQDAADEQKDEHL